MTENAKKDLRIMKTLSVIEGACYFMAGVCAVMSASTLGYISGALMIILACMSLLPNFIGRGSLFVNMETSLVKNENLDEFSSRVEEDEANENEDS